MNVMQIGMALIGSDLTFRFRLAPHQWVWAACIALGGTTAHYCLTIRATRLRCDRRDPARLPAHPLIALVAGCSHASSSTSWCSSRSDHRVGIVWNLRAEMR